MKIHGTGDISNYSYQTAPWYGQRGSIRKVTIDEGITSIGRTAFYNMTINEIKLPDSLKTIKSEAFREANLTSIELPKNMESLESMVFCGAHIDLIIQPNEKLQISPAIFQQAGPSLYSGYDSKLICKGKTSECERITQPVLDWYETHQNQASRFHGALTFSSYEKYDTNNNPVELCGADGCTKYAYDSGGNLIKKTDGNGHILWRRKIYSVDEATRAADKKNTFSIIYR